ncbi:efflux transporter outer membrane subunit [Acetobacter estunensis]|uniref:Efflux transporter outer membrane subunit n=4 Tax=Acetobacteraceae TaxID=433 RepID=A0A967B8W4_9PROT|nr:MULTISPECIES: efflux transporter outer membrane subunit [Acetobacteraceae]NHO55048.1 efflux transporter outer membrane subunit [Acetobacter estunensis]POF61267.1 Toluene efflux pump outer membrane protein TtgC precursor [Novacetimonas maltaceti]
MNGVKRLGFALLGLMVSACTVGPDFHDPRMPSGDRWHESLPASSSKADMKRINPQWWEVYHDPILDDLERQVAAKNLDLRAASFRYAQSQAERKIAGAAQFPSLNGNAYYQRNQISANGVRSVLGTPIGMTHPTPAFNLPTYGLSASWEVDLWGHVRRSVESARAAMDVTDEMRRDVIVSLMAEAARDYIELRAVQAEMAIIRQNLAVARRSVELTTLRFTKGVTTTLDVDDSEALYHTFNARLPVLRNQQVHLINALSFLIAREPGALTALLEAPHPIPSVPSVIDIGVPSELADRRPDIRMAAAKLHVATANIGVAIADFLPRVTLSGTLDMQAMYFSKLGNWASRQYGFGPTMTVPLFEGGRLRGQLMLRKAQQQEAFITYQRTTLNAWHEIDDALASFSAAQQQRDELRQAVAHDNAAVNTAQRQYAAGAADFLNVLTLQSQLLAAENQLIQSEASVSTSVAQLYRALGGGWEGTFPLQ